MGGLPIYVVMLQRSPKKGTRPTTTTTHSHHPMTPWNPSDAIACIYLYIETVMRRSIFVASTDWMDWMSHRKQKETKQQPGTAGPGNILGCFLVSLRFPCSIHSIHSVLMSAKCMQQLLPSKPQMPANNCPVSACHVHFKE